MRDAGFVALPWFDTIIPAITVSSNQELSLALGLKTLVYLTGSGAVTIFGMSTIGGNQDGAEVTFCNVSNNPSVQFSFAHESSSASSLLNRFRNKGGTTASSSAGIGAATYRYFGGAGGMQRWLQISLC